MFTNNGAERTFEQKMSTQCSLSEAHFKRPTSTLPPIRIRSHNESSDLEACDVPLVNHSSRPFEYKLIKPVKQDKIFITKKFLFAVKVMKS